MTAQIITQDVADDIINASEYGDAVEDCERTRDGFLYTLEDGSAILVDFDGTVENVTEYD